MSEKVPINLVAGAMKETGVTPEQIRAVMEALRAELAANEKEEKPPACKKQFVILISDPDNLLPKTDFAGWVLQLEESESVATTRERIYRAAYDYNASKKGRLYPAWTVGEAIENVPAKILKGAGVWAKTKSPVLMLKCDNQIPKADPTSKLPFQDLCKEHGTTVEIRAGGKSVTIDGNGARCVETRDGRKITTDEMLSEIKANFAKGKDT